MSRLLLVLTAAATACAPIETPMLPGLCGPAVVPMDVVAAPDVDEEAVRAAAELWGGLLLVDEVPSTRWEACLWGCMGTATVYHAELPEGVLGDTFHATDGAGGVTACEIRLTPWFDADPLVLAHELGHCLGLGHSDDEDSIMHTPVRPWAAPLAGEFERVREGCHDGSH